MPLAHETFADFHLHGASAPEWNQRYVQLSPGTMRSSLAELSSEGLHVFRKWMSERVVQQGCLPAGQICFTVPLHSASGTPRMQGREMADDSLFVLRGGDEFTLQRPPGMELLALTFEREPFLALLDARPWSKAARALLARPALRVRAASLVRLRRELLALLALSTDGRGGPAIKSPAGDSAPMLALFESLRAVFADAADEPPRAASASAGYVVAQCHARVAASAHAPPSIEALSHRLGISRRTLQSAFRQVADTTPVHYLRSVRLNAVRRALLAGTATELDVAQAATDHGFEHLSHFSARYKALFGELPSRTHRRAVVAGETETLVQGRHGHRLAVDEGPGRH